MLSSAVLFCDTSELDYSTGKVPSHLWFEDHEFTFSIDNYRNSLTKMCRTGADIQVRARILLRGG